MTAGRRIGVRVCAALVAATGVAALAGCGSGGVDSGGLTADDRMAAQAAMDALRDSNIPIQLVNITDTVQSVPAACRVRLVSRKPSTFRVYVFWVPWLGSQPYTWLDMTIGKDVSQDRFHLGTEQPVLPGGRLDPNKRDVNPYTVDTTLLSRYGPQQAKKNREVLGAHAGDVFSKPGARCQVLMNGHLRLVPNRERAAA
jgi:hypothetical protein